MKNNCYYYIIIGLIFIFNCENVPIETQIDSGGHKLFTYSNNNAVFKTIQLSNKIGNSSNLYVGRVNNKQSFAMIKLNSDIFSGNELICNNETIDSVSFKLNLSFDPLYTSFQSIITNADSILYSNFSNDDDYLNSNSSLNGYLTFQDDLSKIWNENSSLDYNDINNFFIFDDDSLHIDSLKNNNLSLEIGEANIVVHLDSIINNISIVESLCSGDDQKSLIILLEYTGDGNIVIESANSPFLQPYLQIDYRQKELEYEAYSKIDILSLDNYLNIDSIYIQLDPGIDEFGTVLGFASIIDTNSIVDSNDLNNKIDLFDIIVMPNFHENDSSNLIEFSFQDIHFVYRNYDPSGDNFDSLLNIDGTENNYIWDYGELFYDCGKDGLCNEDEEGFNPNGTENNNIYDLGEPFLDYGSDGVPDSLEVQNPDLDNYNPDPNDDDYDEEFNNMGTENNNICDLGEVFLDYGLDGIPDSLEGVDFEYDNYDPTSNPNGTENNNIWDEGEWFKDTGIDGLWNIDELGYNLGTEGNGIYDLGEFYYDFGLNGFPDSLEENSSSDNYLIDPNGDDWKDCGLDRCCDPYEDGDGGCLENINTDYLEGDDFNSDNFNIELNDLGTENNLIYDYGENWEGNNIIDWYDQNGDSLYSFSENDSGEVWFDFGIDQIQNSNEPYYGSFPLSYTVGINSYSINTSQSDIDTIFNQPDTTDSHDVNLWISRVQKDINDNLILTISINTIKEIAAFQFKLDHYRFFNSDTLWNSNSANFSYINSLRLIEDISVYKQNNYELDDSIFVNYSESFSALIDFPELNLFVEENPNVIISNALLTLYPDSIISNDDDYFRLYLNRILDSNYNGEVYIDSLSSQYILDYPYYYSYLSSPDSIQFNVKRYIQKLVAQEYEYDGLLLFTDGLGNNFDYFYFQNSDQVSIKLDILYSK